MLKVSGINQYYSESHTLWDVELEVKQGMCTCLMGRNGVGKTTLLKSVMGLVSVTSGEIEFDGQKITTLDTPQRVSAGIGYVPQGREIFPQLTVEENLRLGFLQSSKNVAKEGLEKIFALFPVLKKMLSRRGGDLSGGQQQQLAIGRALALGPKLLILDEPTEGIQPNVVHEIGDVLLKLLQDGLTILLVEQKLPFARRVGQQFVLMDRGRSVASDEMSALSEELVAKHLVV